MTDHDRTRPLWADLPHGDEISALLDELRTLSPDEARAMATARGAVVGEAWRAAGAAAVREAWKAALDGAGGEARNAPGGVAWRTALETMWDATPIAAHTAARDAMLALVVADLVGQYGLTRDHLDILTAPARTIPRLSAVIDRALPEGES